MTERERLQCNAVIFDKHGNLYRTTELGGRRKQRQRSVRNHPLDILFTFGCTMNSHAVSAGLRSLK